MKKFVLILFLFCVNRLNADQGCPVDTIFPFTTDSTHIKIWNKTEYIPFFIKSCNFGVCLPGKYPGQLEVSRAQYGNWFRLIKEAGFNSIRLYTLHFPDFYEVLDSFNLANKENPLFFFQGVWLEEELPGYNNDLRMLDTIFSNEIRDEIDCVHGNNVIASRLGKAYGNYTTDASQWNIGYIIAREISPGEALTTNQAHPEDTVYTGTYFSLSGNPSEIFIASHLDELDSYEFQNYHTQRPVSFSNWPTLDPLTHPEEPNRWEDSVSIDLNNIDWHNAPAGCFASFHAYPYYPDFISDGPAYQSYSDVYGPNSYLGYLSDLKNHYNRMPLIVAETGVPSSWGIAHYASSGMNHGGFDETDQGETIMRILHSAESSGCGGVMNFAWMDEWFKRTWITDAIDYNIESRILWHNIMAAEQNFGLIGFQRDLVMQPWDSFPAGHAIRSTSAAADFDFFHLGIALNDTMNITDDMWISFDTYQGDLGESILPNGDTLTNRAEFALHITNYSAQLYVTQAYDIFRIWSHTSSPLQLYHSIPTDGAPWVIERWENNDASQQIQYVGDLNVKRNYITPSSTDAVTIYPDSVHIRIPWSLLNFTDPSHMRVFNDSIATSTPEDTVSDGIAISISYHNQFEKSQTRFTWINWDSVPDAHEYEKASYNIVKSRMPELNNPAIAISDSYTMTDSFPYYIQPGSGVLANDFDLDGTNMQAMIIGNASHGNVSLNPDGSFTYNPDTAYSGPDYFEYCIFDGHSLSTTAYVCLDITNNIIMSTRELDNLNVKVFPNPAQDYLKVETDKDINSISVFDSKGVLINEVPVTGRENQIDLSEFKPGNYFIKADSKERAVLSRFAVVR